MAFTSFKAIIIGGGPAGLTAAHALYLAGIDFLILEGRESVVVDQGASLVLGPQSLRVMHQFGLLDKLRAIGGEIGHCKAFTLDGREFKIHTLLKTMRQNHGSAPIAFHRAQLIQTLYDGLPSDAREKYLTGKKVEDISFDKQSAKVTCADGSTYEGSIVIGADGVHSKTRRLMRKLALESNPQAEWDAETPYTCAYRCMWCSFPRPSDSGEAFETQHKDQSVMYLTGHERGWIFLYEKLPEPTTERTSYTDVDVDAFAARFADFPVTDTLKVKDVFAKKLTAGMANLEEGVLQHWSMGRIALVGDACHKFTPNAGLGFQNGIQDVVALINSVRTTVLETPGGDPSVKALTEVFQKYQTDRVLALKPDVTRSAQTTRMHAWSNSYYFVAARYILALPLVEYLLLKYVAARQIKQGLVLDYVPCEEPLKGDVEWVHQMKNSATTASGLV
ncbi:hypothetical protein BGZ61DRAFT_366106 [Ilyonectria robusta]|uniref:uncharacterized protein n=1 Tax=Ilyonectria robusta TaxID=1079257 RepID=UPI001E8D101C|nr:uncharacterized protein BGZ61DRAFT_366106 [Ilyonectria robusta]KAH8665554.1 hypothetical protein BGZ61DRAFT_366106 [Ilyonectria robusta]